MDRNTGQRRLSYITRKDFVRCGGKGERTCRYIGFGCSIRRRCLEASFMLFESLLLLSGLLG
ncbi:MAG: hypothetical protein DMF00_10325 [Verrucomicrobia bacterium]|nr:MAG: hypothetical protein DMF00_10325 [Verrucomicrobiota bacterium]